MYRVRTEAEMAKRLKRKLKRKREKERAKKGGGEGEGAWGGDDDEGEGIVAADELELIAVVRTKAKTRGFAFAPKARRRPGVRAVLAVLLENNAVEEWELAAADDDDDPSEPTKTRARSCGPPRGRSRGGTLPGRRHPPHVLAQGRQGVEPVDGRVFAHD